MIGLLFGCTTIPTGSNVRAEVAGWVEDTSVILLLVKPEHRIFFGATYKFLEEAESSDGKITLDTVTSVLSQVEIFQSVDSKIALAGGRLILRRTFGNVALETPDVINNVGLGIKDGLKAALEATQ